MLGATWRLSLGALGSLTTSSERKEVPKAAPGRPRTHCSPGPRAWPPSTSPEPACPQTLNLPAAVTEPHSAPSSQPQHPNCPPARPAPWSGYHATQAEGALNRPAPASAHRPAPEPRWNIKRKIWATPSSPQPYAQASCTQVWDQVGGASWEDGGRCSPPSSPAPPGLPEDCAGRTAGPLAFGTSAQGPDQRPVQTDPCRPVSGAPSKPTAAALPRQVRHRPHLGETEAAPKCSPVKHSAMLPLVPAAQHRCVTQRGGQGWHLPPRDRGLALFRDGETKGQEAQRPPTLPGGGPCNLPSKELVLPVASL